MFVVDSFIMDVQYAVGPVDTCNIWLTLALRDAIAGLYRTFNSAIRIVRSAITSDYLL